MKLVRSLLRRVMSIYRVPRRYINEYASFYRRDFISPHPNLFKMKTLLHFADSRGSWLETGTYMGSTTKFLAKRFPMVITIEPSEYFFNHASSRLQNYNNISFLKGTSEDFFEKSLIAVSPRGNLWLDGHYSEGNTYLGNIVTPIEIELLYVAKHKDKFDSLVVFVDDIRLFPRTDSEDNGYPKFQWLIDWCRDNDFKWELQNDILIARLEI